MRTKEELAPLISEHESKISKMKADLDGYYEALEPQVDPLIKKSNELEASKSEIKKKYAPAYLWIIVIALVIAAIAIRIPVVRVILVAAAIVVGVYLGKTQAGLDAEYDAQIAEIDKKQDAIEKKIDKVYASDPRIKKTENEIEKTEAELKALKIEYSDLEIYDKIGTNNLILYCNFAKLYTIDEAFVQIDKEEAKTFRLYDEVSMYLLDPGEHTFCMCIFPIHTDADRIVTDLETFTLNNTNKYMKATYSVEEKVYRTKLYDTFDEFAESMGRTSRSDKEILMKKILDYNK